MHRPTTVLRPGARIPARQLTAVSGAVVPLPDPDRVVHLQFRRFAGCPICNLHLQSIVRRHHAIGQAGVREVVIFHSTDEDLRLHTPTLPFDVVADPDQLLYAEFGVTASPRALLHPKAWAAILLAIPRSATAIARGREHAPAAKPHGGRLGLPADFLIASDGRIAAAKYGEHAYDQWSVDELLRKAAGTRRPADRPDVCDAEAPATARH